MAGTAASPVLHVAAGQTLKAVPDIALSIAGFPTRIMAVPAQAWACRRNPLYLRISPGATETADMITVGVGAVKAAMVGARTMARTRTFRTISAAATGEIGETTILAGEVGVRVTGKVNVNVIWIAGPIVDNSLRSLVSSQHGMRWPWMTIPL